MTANTLKFGISTTVLREHPVSYALEQIAQAGYKSAEVWTWHLERWGENPIMLGQQAHKLGLNLTMHAPVSKLNPTATDEDEAVFSQRRITESLELASAMGVKVVAVHPGKCSYERDSVDDVWERFVIWVSELDRKASRLDLKIGLELMEKIPGEIFMLPNDAARLMENNLPQIGLTIDIAHMNTHMPPIKFLQAINPEWIIHAHLSDNAPWRVHLPLGDGKIDLFMVLNYLGKIYNGVVSIEGSVPGQGEELLRRNYAYLNKHGLI